jgi:hypothetical protein
MPDMSQAQTAGVADSFFAKMADEAKKLEASERQLKANIAGLSADRDRVIGELEVAQKQLAGVKQRLKEADAQASRTVQEAQANAAATLAAAKQEAKTLLENVRKRIATAQQVLEGDK